MKGPLPTLRPTVLVLLLPLAAAFSQEGPPRDGQGPKGRAAAKGERERSEAWESLSPDQRESLRHALREVWNDPAVISAREEVKQASDAYQSAVKAAVNRVDPSLGEALAKLQGAGGVISGPLPPPGAGAPGGGQNAPGALGFRRGFEGSFRPPGFLEGLPPEMRDRFRKAEAAANESGRVREAREALAKLRGEDEGLRRRRLEAFRELRLATIDEIVRADPGLEPMRKRLLEGERPGPPSADGTSRPVPPKPPARGGESSEEKPGKKKEGSKGLDSK